MTLFLRVDLISFCLQLNPMHRTAVFFYGTFMSSRVLQEHGIACDSTLPAKVSGYRLSIRPRVNLHLQADEAVYGGLAEVTHAELSSLYDGLRTTFGINYHPFPVLAQLANGNFEPALCYLSFDIPDAPPDPNYLHAVGRRSLPS